jgi:hypothetical protein
LIRRSIGRYGYGGNDFINKAYNNIQQDVLEKYGDYVAGYLGTQIDQFIDKIRIK